MSHSCHQAAEYVSSIFCNSPSGIIPTNLQTSRWWRSRNVSFSSSFNDPSAEKSPASKAAATDLPQSSGTHPDHRNSTKSRQQLAVCRGFYGLDSARRNVKHWCAPLQRWPTCRMADVANLGSVSTLRFSSPKFVTKNSAVAEPVYFAHQMDCKGCVIAAASTTWNLNLSLLSTIIGVNVISLEDDIARWTEPSQLTHYCSIFVRKIQGYDSLVVELCWLEAVSTYYIARWKAEILTAELPVSLMSGTHLTSCVTPDLQYRSNGSVLMGW